jgi:TatD DNase family protein
MTLIDTHCHLFWKDFDHDLPEVIDRARDAGIGPIIVPATDLDTMEIAYGIARRFPRVFATAGVHPHDAGKLPADAFERIDAFAANPEIVAIGEIGLDYYYDFCPPAVQQEALHRQLDIAGRHGLPVVIHNREADEDVLAICREHQDGALRGQFHCFSSSRDYAERVLELGFHISFTGNVTYKKSTLADAVAAVPDDRLLLETDAPFMAPTPWRGKRNEPAYLALIAARIAELRGHTADHVAGITTRNAIALFSLSENQSTHDGHE